MGDGKPLFGLFYVVLEGGAFEDKTAVGDGARIPVVDVLQFDQAANPLAELGQPVAAVPVIDVGGHGFVGLVFPPFDLGDGIALALQHPTIAQDLGHGP